MRHTIAIAAAFVACSATPVAAQEEVVIGAEPEWVEPSPLLEVPADASGLIFFRRQDTLVRLHSDGQSHYVGQWIKLLHPQALQIGNLSIAWNPSAGRPTVHALRIHREGTVIDVLENRKFEVLRREENLEQAHLDGLLTAVLQVPDLRVEDELELAFTVPGHDPTLGSESFGLLALAPAPPGGRFRLGLSWESGQKPAIRLTEDFEPYTTRSADALNVAIDNPAVIAPPKDAPPRYNWQRLVEFGDFANWAEVSRRFDELFDGASALDGGSAVRREAERIADAHESERERAAAALELVQQEVRYIYVGLDGGNFTPATADETWQRRYGDCKGKTALLLALLRELDIPAQAVLATNSGLDDGFDQRLPGPSLFDHVLVRATVDGETLWMDGTLPPVARAGTRPLIPYRWVLPLSEEGSALEQVEQRPFRLPREMGLFEIDARAGFDQPARLVYTTVKRGLEGLQEHVQLAAVTDAQLEQSFRSSLTGSAQWDSIEDVSYRFDEDTMASVLTIEGTGPVEWEAENDGGYWLSLPGGGFSPPGRRQRAADQDQDAPFYDAPSYSCHVTTVRLPEATDLENWGFNSTFDTMMFGSIYYRMMEKRDDGTIRMVRGSRVENAEISAEQARRDNIRLENFDNSKANISYEPGETMQFWGELVPVPATYEFDWTSADAPCLPLDVLEETQ